MSVVKQTLLYLADKLSGFKTMSFLKELKNTSLLPQQEIRRLQWGRLKELLEFVYENNEFYRKKFQRSKLRPQDIKEEEDFKNIPLLTADELNNYRSAIISGGEDFFVQSGSTMDNLPKQTYVSYSCASKKYALYLRHLLNCGWDFDVKIIHFLPAIYRKRVVYYEHGLKQFLSTIIQHKIAHDFITKREIVFYDDLNLVINDDKLKNYCRKINAHKKFIITGRADFLNILAHNCNKAGMNIERPVSLINIGTLLPLPIAGRIEKFFDAPVYNIYGSSELSYIAGSCRCNRDLHVNEETHYVEAIKDNPDLQWGSLVVTDLFNYSMPFIRYETQELGNLRGDKCNCGHLRLLDVGGRKQNCVRFNDGRLLSEWELSSEVFTDSHILQFSLLVHKDGGLRMEIVTSDRQASRKSLAEKLENIGLEGVEIELVDKLSTPYLNKHQYIKKR